MSRLRLPLATLAFLLILPAGALSQEFKGADAAIPKPKSAAPQNDVMAEIQAFEARVDSLPPAEAAAGWIALVRKVRKEVSSPNLVGMGTSYGYALAGAVPGPAAWPEISKALTAKGSNADDALTALYVAELRQDPYSRVAALEKLRAAGKDHLRDGLGMDLAGFAGSASELIASAAETKDVDLTIRAIKVAPLETPYGGGTRLALAKAFGETKAKGLYAMILMRAKGELMFDGPKEMALAREVALKNVAKLKAPFWNLARGKEGAALKAALTKRFKNAPVETQRTVGSDRMMALLKAGDRATLAKEIQFRAPESTSDLGNWIGTAKANGTLMPLVDALHTAIGSNKAQPGWYTFYSDLAFATGKSSQAIADYQKLLANPKLKPQTKTMLRAALVQSLLAISQVDAAIAQIRISENGVGGYAGSRRYAYYYTSSSAGSDYSYGSSSQVLQIARAAGRKDLIDDELKRMATHGEWINVSLFEYERGDYVAAEAAMLKLLQSSNGGINTMTMGGTYLPELASIYDAAGRSGDVLKLLAEHPGWGAGDLRQLSSETGFHNLPLLTIAARALHKEGRTAEAKPIILYAAQLYPADDPTLMAAGEILGEESLELFDRLLKIDPYEERPLIAKAAYLKSQSRLDEAEAAARAAIAIDPSDGGTPYGRRMYVYSVLADILAAKGNAEDAETYRNAVAAIRMGEEGDEYLGAGLTQKSIEAYLAAAKRFDDAYCVQSRLAMQLAEAGRLEEAKVHFQRAFELMPESFGEVETHCFACEGAFSTPTARKIGESVLVSLKEKLPKKPQIPYLLGLLRMYQGALVDARGAFRTAITLDPNYLNAWVNLRAVELNLDPNGAGAKETANRIATLDPLGRHTYTYGGNEADTKRRWYVIADRLKLFTPAPESLLPLTASAKTPYDPMAAGMRGMDYGPYAMGATSVITSDGRVATRPAQVIAGRSMAAYYLAYSLRMNRSPGYTSIEIYSE